jgi:hypothetical protein
MFSRDLSHLPDLKLFQQANGIRRDLLIFGPKIANVENQGKQHGT